MTIRRLSITAGALIAAGVGAAVAAEGPAAAPAAGRGTYDPFALRRALQNPTAQDHAAAQRRIDILRWLASTRVPGNPHARSPFRPGPPPWTPPGGGTTTNPGGNQPGTGTGNGNGNGNGVGNNSGNGNGNNNGNGNGNRKGK